MTGTPVPALIPRPDTVRPTGRPVSVPRELPVVIDTPLLDAWALALDLLTRLDRLAMLQAPGAERPGGSGAVGGFALHLCHRGDLEREEYDLEVGEGGVRIAAAHPDGARHALRTWQQTIGEQAFRCASTRPGDLVVPGLHVHDRPALAHRGVLLDVARHFLPKAVVLRFVDLASAHKLNVLHLHLTDDQGWRLAVDAFPELTAVGAWRTESQVGSSRSTLFDARPHGGYYTAEDCREIVAYARARGMRVVPEIESPGHAQAAIASRPELAAGVPAPTGPWTRWGLNPLAVTPGPDGVDFYRRVLDQVMDVFDDETICVGGDEVAPGAWDADPLARDRAERLGVRPAALLPAFVNELASYLAGHGRRASVWDEALGGRVVPDADGEAAPSALAGGPDAGGQDGSGSEAGGPAPGGQAGGGPTDGEGPIPAELRLRRDVVVNAWRGTEIAVAALRAGHDVIWCPEHELYLDHRAAEGPAEPAPVGTVSTTADVLAVDPHPPALRAAEAEPGAGRVLGVQAQVWSEQLADQRRVDYAAFPRLCAVAEIAWGGRPGHWPEFADRLETHLANLRAAGVEYRPPTGPHPWQRLPGVPGAPLRFDEAGRLVAAPQGQR